METIKRVCYPSLNSLAGGANNSVLLLAKHMPDRFYEPLVVFPDDKGPIFRRAQSLGLRTKILSTTGLSVGARRGLAHSRWGKLLLTALALPYFARVQCFLNAARPDIVHANSLMGALIWGAAAAILRIPLVWHVRQERSSAALDRLRLAIADEVIFPANVIRDKFSRHVLEQTNYSVIYNGVDLEQFTPQRVGAIRKELGLHPSQKLVGFVGDLVPRKRPELFVRVAIDISRLHSDAHFIIVGDDPSGAGCLKQLRKLVFASQVDSSRFSFVGHREDVARIMSDLDVLLFTSEAQGEAFPRVVIEALSCGVPVVATAVSGVPEAIEHGRTGYLVDSEDVSALVQNTLTLLADDEKRAQMGAAGRQSVMDRFDAKATANQVADVYDRLLVRVRKRRMPLRV